VIDFRYHLVSIVANLNGHGRRPFPRGGPAPQRGRHSNTPGDTPASGNTRGHHRCISRRRTGRSPFYCKLSFQFGFLLFLSFPGCTSASGRAPAAKGWVMVSALSHCDQLAPPGCRRACFLHRNGRDSPGTARMQQADAIFRMICSSFPSQGLQGLWIVNELTASGSSDKELLISCERGALRTRHGTDAAPR
jgi:hypothetical protein